MSMSPALDAVVAANHPAPEDGGPCATCAFRPGTEANKADYTMALATSCVEGLLPFHCHEHQQLCRGWAAAVNLNGTPERGDDAARQWVQMHRHAACILSDLIDKAKSAEP